MTHAENNMMHIDPEPKADREKPQILPIENFLNFEFHSKLPVILQSESAECGLACLAMVSSFYGYSIDLISLRRNHPISQQGMDLSQLADIAGRMNFASRAIRIEISELSQIKLPCIIHWNVNHFVVIKSIHANHVIIHDPAYGKRKISRAQFEKQFTGVALELFTTKDFEKKDNTRRLKISDLWSEIIGLRKSLIQIIVISLLIECLTIIAPLYSQIIIDLIPKQHSLDAFYTIALGFTLIMFTQIAVSAARDLALLRLSSQLNIQMAANLFYHLVRLPLSFFMKRHVGDILSRFGSLSHIRQMITTGILSAVLDGLMAIITLAVLWYYNTQLTIVVLAVVAIYIFMRIAFYEPFKQLNLENLIASAKENSHFMETLRAIQTLKIFQQENDRQLQWLNRLAATINKEIKIAQWGIGFSAAQGTIFGLENIIVVLLAAKLVMTGSFTIGMLFAFMSFKISFISAVNNLITQAINFKMLDIHLERISDIAFTEKENINEHLPKVGNAINAPVISGKIEAFDLAYRFDGKDEDLFSNLSFTIESGESVAIVGPSGCGKTTLMKCLMGLLEPTQGKILIDGKPIKSLKQYRSQIAGVMQDDQLVSGSIKDNITLFSSTTDWHRIYLATSKACVHDEILNFTMDYETLVGDMGSSLSGGQKQRIVLARALYREPRILFLDEATSHLDIANESLVNQHIKDLAITKVLIAHRPETIKSADKKILMGGALASF
ncbi:peptidase domain-containing ABC transporter [Cellvibrio sp.]|uniref:peptidase domain-containing ABC transporter n=1 Tax=Cellvibrio sp. TaxID=1965322 RepID=UPI00396489D4